MALPLIRGTKEFPFPNGRPEVLHPCATCGHLTHTGGGICMTKDCWCETYVDGGPQQVIVPTPVTKVPTWIKRATLENWVDAEVVRENGCDWKDEDAAVLNEKFPEGW